MYATCSTGLAGGSRSHSYFCPFDIPNGAIPNGGGQLCYNSVEACSQGPNSCNTTLNPALCEPQLGICSTGQAAGTGLATVALHDSGATAGVVGYNFFCLTDLPAGSLPAGSGAVCYQSQDQCSNGPNGCNATVPCQQNFQECPTGIAGSDPVPHTWMCPLDYPTGAQPNGFGGWCYSDSIACMEGPNSCTNSAPCALDLTTCSTGVAGDLPVVASATFVGL